MGTLRLFLFLVLWSLASGASAAALRADPARWGVYAKLVGFEYQGVKGSWKRTKNWRWTADGTSLIEEDVGYAPTTIRQGANPGELVLSYSNTTFDGKIAGDGSVLWIRRGTIKLPYRVALEGGELREEKVKLAGNEIASVKSVFRYTQSGKLAGMADQPVTVPAETLAAPTSPEVSPLPTATAVIPKPPVPVVATKAPTVSDTKAVDARPAPGASANGTLTFMLGISLQVTINRMNGQCFSNLISVPGPAGWPGPGPGRGNAGEAAAIVKRYFPEFLAKCGQIAPVGRGEPYVVWNNRGNEGRLLEEYARAKRNRMPEVNISP